MRPVSEEYKRGGNFLVDGVDGGALTEGIYPEREWWRDGFSVAGGLKNKSLEQELIRNAFERCQCRLTTVLALPIRNFTRIGHIQIERSLNRV